MHSIFLEGGNIYGRYGKYGIYTRNDKMTRRCRREKSLYKSWGTRKGWFPRTGEGQRLMGILAVTEYGSV